MLDTVETVLSTNRVYYYYSTTLKEKHHATLQLFYLLKYTSPGCQQNGSYQRKRAFMHVICGGLFYVSLEGVFG